MENDFTPKTAEEFINYYTDKLKTDLEVYDIQTNKVGFLGFLLNLLGYTNYDLKNYYDFLFNESFIATAETNENLFFHASTYGYYSAFATPSEAKGYLEVDFHILPTKQTNVVKRELYINNTGQLFKFESEGYEFTTKSSYKLVYENGQYKTIIITEDGKAIQYPSSNGVLKPPLINTTQYSQTDYTFKSPNYPANSFYSYVFEIDDGFISDLKVFVTKEGETTEEEYEVKYIKYLETGSSKTVFLKKNTQNKYTLELGSGLRGEWLPQATIRLQVNITKGDSGNFLKLAETSQKEPQQVILIDYNDSNEIVSTTNLSANQITMVKIESSENGKDPYSGDVLRDDIIKYIQSRDNLVSENDFYNIASKYMSDFKFLFKKIQVYDNIFHLCRSFRNKYQTTIQTNNHYIEESNFTTHYRPEFTIDDVEFVSPFLYKYNTVMNWYDGYLMIDNLLEYLNSISLSDDVPPTYTVPPLYFNLIYQNFIGRTRIQIKSYQDISDLTFKITINELNIYNQDLIFVDENTFELIYTENSGVIFEDINIQIDGYENSVKMFFANSDLITQTYNITDVLNLTRYERDEVNYITGIPILNKDEFYSQKEFYLEKIKHFIYDSRFMENRMISDNTQFRFLNSYLLQSPFLEETVVQNKDFLDIVYLWLTDVLSFENDPTSLTLDHSDRFIVGLNPVDSFISHSNEIAEWYELAEITHIETNDASTLSGGEYFILNTPSVNYYCWYNIDSGSTDPTPASLTGIEINILSTDTALELSDKTTSVLNNHFSFTANFNDNLIIVINEELGESDNASDVDTSFIITTEQEGIDGHFEFDPPSVINNETEGVLVSDEPARYYFDTDLEEWILMKVKYPLKLYVELKINNELVRLNNIILSDEKQNIELQLADLLQKVYTGTDIKYYNSQIIDFIHTERDYIKSVKVYITDSNDVLIPNGIETKDDRKILEDLSENKFNIVRYTPTFWWWDIDNISLLMKIE